MKRKVTRRRSDFGVAFPRLAIGNKRLFDQRTIRVLGSLVVGMTLVSGILLALEPGETYRANPWSLSVLEMSSDSAREEILGVQDRQWDYIIIHDSRGIRGGERELDREYNRDYIRNDLKARGAGYHFVINDEMGQSDGAVQIAKRWKNQQPGDYITGERSDKWNREAIGVCIMGDADNKPFSDDRIESTVELVRMLQEAYDIPRENVIIHTGRSANSSAQFFPFVEFRSQIRD